MHIINRAPKREKKTNQNLRQAYNWSSAENCLFRSCDKFRRNNAWFLNTTFQCNSLHKNSSIDFSAKKKKMLSPEVVPENWNSEEDDQHVDVLFQTIRRMLWINFGVCSLSILLTSSNMDLKFTETPNTQFCHCEPHPRLQLAFLICCQFLLCTFCLLIFFQTDCNHTNKDVLSVARVLLPKMYPWHGTPSKTSQMQFG